MLSPFWKLFAQIINERLKEFTENFNMIESCQSGFRKHYSTADNLFIINSLVDTVKSNKSKLYCCFIDLNTHSIGYGERAYGEKVTVQYKW